MGYVGYLAFITATLRVLYFFKTEFSMVSRLSFSGIFAITMGFPGPSSI